MKNFTINIFYKFHRGAWGGGNQFLKALRKRFIMEGFYEDNPKNADCIIFNSHQNYKKILQFKLENQNKIFIHRIDGPISLINGNHRIDCKIYEINDFIADATIFQSHWSKKKNCSFGLKKNRFETIIMNASDNSIFFPVEKIKIDNNKDKWQIVAVSWSSNINKGFALYQFIDENLDFNQYSMLFIGNCPISFKNIKQIKPLESKELAKILRKSEIFITGSKNDPCSNSLIEALSCGLPCVVLNDGGHPEIIKNGGETSNTNEEFVEKIQLIKNNYNLYRKNIHIPTIEETSELYYKFAEKIYLLYLNNKYNVKKLRLYDYYKILLYNNNSPLQKIKKMKGEFFRIISLLKSKLSNLS